MKFLALFLVVTVSIPARAELVTLKLAGGRTIPAEIRSPSSAERLPAVMIFGGFENAARVLDLVKPTRPVILATFDYPFTPPRKLEFPQSLRHLPEAKRFIHETVEGISVLRRELASRPDVDPQKIVVLGASFGAPFALAAARADAGIQGVAIVHGFADVVETSTQQLMRSFRKRFGEWTYPLAWALCRAGFLYINGPRPEDDASRLKSSQRVLMVSADQDSFIPQESTELLWASIQRSQAESERVRMPGDHLQPGSDALISEIMKIVQGWMGRVGLS